MTDQHQHQQLIEETLQLMNLSSMEEDEKNMWTIMLPSMEKEEIEKLKGALEREAKAMTDIYLNAKKSKS
jgi:hypothetical protein